MEWGTYNINVNCIAPGRTNTELFAASVKRADIDIERSLKRTPLGKLLEPEDIAKAALFLVSDDASQITGVTLPVDGGWVAYGWD